MRVKPFSELPFDEPFAKIQENFGLQNNRDAFTFNNFGDHDANPADEKMKKTTEETYGSQNRKFG